MKRFWQTTVAALRAAAATRFYRYLAGISVVALALRVVICYLGRDHPVWGDANVYRIVASHIADGDGFQASYADVPTAEHPPLWEVVLAAAFRVGVQGTFSDRLIGAMLGTVTVVLLGLLGRRFGGDALGLVAAGVGALYAPLWIADMTIMSESLYGALLVGALLAAAYRRPMILGALLGLAALTRGEALVLVVLLVAPLFWRRWRELAFAVAAFALVLAPWTVRNLVTFDKPVLISVNSNSVWTGANCDRSYYGDFIGSWYFYCYSELRPGEDESVYSARQRTEGLQYMREHADRVPAVAGVRFLRLVDMWRPDQAAFLNAAEGRPVIFTRIGFWTFWTIVPFAIAGVVLARRRREQLLIMLAPIVMVVGVAITTYGSTRLRYGAEPSIVLLSAIAFVALYRWIAPAVRRRAGGRAPARVASADRPTTP